MDTPSFIKVNGTSYTFANEGTFKFYVPERFFNNKLAEFQGEVISLFGVIPYSIHDKDDKPIGGLHIFKYPICFLTQPDEIESVKDLRLTKNNDPTDYRILKYHKDGIIVLDYNIAQTSDDIQRWYNALDTGALPINIPYNELQDYFIKNVRLTGNGYKVSLQLIGVVIGELCRSRKDNTKPFRLEDSNDMTSYKWCPIKDIPRDVSPYTAITSEEWDKAVISAITVDSTKDSPLEKVMMD